MEVDLIERLPMPWGLVHAGFEPRPPAEEAGHCRLYAFFLADRRARFFGNVEIDRDIRHAELAEWYDAVIYAVGADSDTRMGISGEESPGCWAAREFVAFYNGHPDYRHLKLRGRRTVPPKPGKRPSLTSGTPTWR